MVSTTITETLAPTSEFPRTTSQPVKDEIISAKLEASSTTHNPVLNNLRNVDWKTISCMALNFASSTSLIIFNKIVMDKFQFRFATTLTCIHLFSTFVLLLLSSRFGIFTIKRLPLLPVFKLAAGTMGFIVLTNLSLQHNSVGFYQVMKVMNTPTVVAIEALLYRKYLESKLKITLLPVCLGVIITTVTDFRLNLVGSVYAVAGVICTSFYQIWSGTLQKSLDCDALQLQTFVSPMATVLILPFLPIFDRYRMTDPDSIWFYPFAPTNMALIAVTGFFGFLVNVSIFLVIGRSSPVSYNVLGHGKTVAILLSDFLLFGRPFDAKSTLGILLTLSGVFWYSSVKLNQVRKESTARERSDDSHATSPQYTAVDVDEEEETLLPEEVRPRTD